MENTNNNWNPDDFAPIPDELIADENEQLMEYAGEEEVVDTISNFLNIEGAEFGEQIFNALKEGEVDPIKVLLMIKKMNHIHQYFLGSTQEKVNPKAKEYLKDKIINIIGKETYQAYGASISIEAIGGATTMDYKECGDIYLNELYKVQKEINDLVKERETFIKTNLPAESKTIGLRTLHDKPNFMPKLTFNTNKKACNISPPIKYSREGIVVRFAKKKK